MSDKPMALKDALRAIINEHVDCDSFVFTFTRRTETGETETELITQGNDHIVYQLADYTLKRIENNYNRKYELESTDDD